MHGLPAAHQSSLAGGTSGNKREYQVFTPGLLRYEEAVPSPGPKGVASETALSALLWEWDCCNRAATCR